SLCNFPCVANSFACASLLAISTLECLFLKVPKRRKIGRAELFLLEIPQYRPSLIRNTIAVAPFRGVGFGACGRPHRELSRRAWHFPPRPHSPQPSAS